jgi:Fe2+ transport system protein B
MPKTTKSNDPTNKTQPDVTKALEVLFASNYINKRKLYLANFLRGIFFGVGSVLGATVVVVILLGILSLFEEIPLIGPVADKFTESINNR